MATRKARQRAVTRKPQSRNYIWIGAGVLAVVLFAGMLITAPNRPRQAQALPSVGVHWHAQYSVVICGDTQPPLPPTPGNVHTHGDGVIHVHPAVASEAGTNANLARFFASAGINLTSTAIQYPDGRAFRNGDTCPEGGTGQIQVVVNGRPNEELERYVPRDGDVIEVLFR